MCRKPSLLSSTESQAATDQGGGGSELLLFKPGRIQHVLSTRALTERGAYRNSSIGHVFNRTRFPLYALRTALG